MKLLLPLVLACGSCAMPSKDARVDIVVRNTTARPLDVRARAGLFATRLRLGPGETWRGWAPRSFVASELTIDVEEVPESASQAP